MSDTSLFWTELQKQKEGQASSSGQPASVSSPAKPSASSTQPAAKDAVKPKDGKGGKVSPQASVGEATKPGYSFFKVTVVGFVLHDGKLLVCKRSDSKQFLPGFYELPGGHLEAGESPQQALQREFVEELGVKIDVLAPFHAFSYSSQTGDDIEIAFFARLANGVEPKAVKPVDVKDVSQVVWAKEQEIDYFKISPQELETMHKGFRLAKA